MLPVALAEAMLQQSRTTPFVPMQSFDAYKRQVPMGLGRAVLFGPLKGGAHVGSLLGSNGLCNNRVKRLIFAVNIRRKPKRDAKPVAGALSRSGCKRAGSERPEKARDVPQIVIGVIIDPAGYRIGPKARTSVAMARSTSASPVTVTTLADFMSMVMFLPW